MVATEGGVRTSFSARTLKGQAAIEYMMTYGWALLVLAIVVIGIYSSGIFSPAYLVSEQCDLGPKLPCEFLAYTDGDETHVDVRITNGFGYRIALTNVSMEIEREGALQVTRLEPSTLESGESAMVETRRTGAVGEGSIQVANIQVGYYSCAPEVNPTCALPGDARAMHSIAGRVVARVTTAQ